MLISLPTGTKVFNWSCSFLGNSISNSLVQLFSQLCPAYFALIFLLMFTLGGSTGAVLGNAAVDLALHDTYYVVAHFHFVLSLGAIIALFSSILFFQKAVLGSFLLVSTQARYHLLLTFVGIFLTFGTMHYLGFNVMPRRLPSFPDYFNSWNYLSSIGSGLTLVCVVLTFWSFPIKCGFLGPSFCLSVKIRDIFRESNSCHR